MIIYKFTNQLNGKLYIGQTRHKVSIETRQKMSQAKFKGNKS